MPDALKTDATLVRGCSAAVWVYPVPQADGRLHFLADSNAAITKGIVALILLAVQDRTPGGDRRDRHRGGAGPLRLAQPAELEPHPGHPQHDRPDPRDRRAARRVTAPDPKSAERFDPKLFMAYVRRAGHGGALGIAYLGHGEDWVELSLPYDERLVGMAESGIIASGPIVSLMDMATSLAIWIRLGKFRHQATLDLRVDYLRPGAARPGDRRPRHLLRRHAERRLRPRPRP